MATKQAKLQKGMVQLLSIDNLHAFPEHPFMVRDDNAMTELVQSIKEYGVLVPIIVRPRKGDGYEIIAGHRRKRACEIAGLLQLPALVYDLDDNAAVLIMVDSNLQREHILPSERAKAYKMKLNAIKRQGARTDLASTQGVQKLSAEIVGEESGMSRDQVRRYIRLTELIPQFQEMVDLGQMALSPAVEVSYLSQEEQVILLDAMDAEQATPSFSQAQRLKRLSRENPLDFVQISQIIAEKKKSEWERVVLAKHELCKFFPEHYTPRQMEQIIWKLLAGWQKRNQQKVS